MEHKSNLFIIVCIVLLFVIILFCLYFYLYRSNRHKTLLIEHKLENDIKDILVKYLKYFSGSMSGLYNISKSSSELYFAESLFDNLQQRVECSNDEKLKKWFFSFTKDRKLWDIVLYTSKAKELIAFFKECGLTHSFENEVVWNIEAFKKYNVSKHFKNGEKYKVSIPCWIYNGQVFEKGYLESN